MFLINGHKQESLAVSDPATTGCLSAVDDFL